MLANQFFKMNYVLLISLFCIGGISACSDNAKTASEYDPGKPVEITGFEPKSGPARTRLYISGKNFGSDVSQISVKIGGLDAKVVGSNGEIIYCIVPAKVEEGTVEVAVGQTENYVQASEVFAYEKRPQVKTLCGYVDEYGQTEAKDGSFDECGFRGPRWLAVDPKHQDQIYVVDGTGEVIRILDVTKRNASTLITKGQLSFTQIRQISFSTTGDTLLIANEESTDTSTAIAILLRSSGYKTPNFIGQANENNACGTHPINGELYFNSRRTGKLFRYDWNTKVVEEQYTVIGPSSQYFIFFHPSGKYAYINVPSKRIIMKSEYDEVNHKLLTPTLFCGKENVRDYADGVGEAARLGNPFQGCFVKNEQYEKEGREDIYDFYFADQYAHAIRYVTPDAHVKTFAGRGSRGLNDDPHGYVDGDLLEEARFYEPAGLIYDSENRIFYVAELQNKRIRVIDMEGE